MATYYWVGGSGTWDNSSKANWSNVSGGASGFGPPLAADTVNFDANSGTSAVVNMTSTAAGATVTVNKSDLNVSLSGSPTITTFVLTTGILTLNSYTLNCNVFSSTGSSARTLAFGTGNITIANSGTTIWNTSTPTNLVVTGTPVVNLTYSGSVGTRTVTTGALTESQAISFNVTAGSDIFATATGYAFKNLNFTGFSGSVTNTTRTIYGNLIFSSGMTCTAGANATTFAGTSGTQQITTNGKTLDFPITFNGVGGTFQLQDNCTVGSTRTVTLTNGTLDLTGNSGNWTLSCGLFSSSNSNTRSIAFGTGNITLTGNNGTVWSCNTLTNFIYTGTPVVNSTYSGATGTRTILHGGDSLGATENNAVSFNITAGTDSVSLGGTTSGTRAYIKNLDLTGFFGTFLNRRMNVYGDYKIASTVTMEEGTNVTQFTATSGTKQLTTAGKTLNFPITFDGVGGTFIFQDALTQGSTRAFTVTNGTVQLKAGVTTTVGAFATSGSNQKYLQSTLAGSQATLSQASGTVGVSYLTIQDINATGGATWNAYYANGNIDGGNNTNWNFGGTPSYDAEYGYKLRSFTETGRF